MSLGQDVLGRLPRALACEWLVANGVGGYASGTAAGANTRAAHALLVAADPHGALTTALLRLDERALGPEGDFQLGCVVQPNGTARPAGHRLLDAFDRLPWPTWRYRLESAVLEKSVLLVDGHHAVVVTYRLLEGPPLRLTVGPVVVSRPPGLESSPGPPAEADLDAAPSPTIQGMPGRMRVQLSPEGPVLTLWHNGVFLPARAWTRLRLPDGGSEAAFLPGSVEATVAPGQPLHLVASVEGELFRALAREARLGSVPPRTLAECVSALEADERERRSVWTRAVTEGTQRTAIDAAVARKREGAAPDPEEWATLLYARIDAGLARRGRRLTLLAHHPAAPEDGSAALRGLLGVLAARGFETAREVLRGYLDYVNDGLAPERFEADGTPVYGDAEPALWLVIAGERYARRSGDLEFARDVLYPALEEVMRFYRSGAPGGIRVDEDGLLVTLHFDHEGLPHPVKRADLNALWSHATVAMSHLARAAGRRENAAFYMAWAHDHQQRFNQLFWDDARGCLHDRLADDAAPGVAPGHLWAVALAPAPLPSERAERMVAAIQHELWTPAGLRDAPGSAAVSSEWIGVFEAARMRAAGRTPDAIAAARAAVATACETLLADGSIAWTPLAAAELLRFWVEDCEHGSVPTEPAASGDAGGVRTSEEALEHVARTAP